VFGWAPADMNRHRSSETPLLRPETPPRGERPIYQLTPSLTALGGRAVLALFQQSSEDDPADGFLRKVIPGSGHFEDDDRGDDDALADD